MNANSERNLGTSHAKPAGGLTLHMGDGKYLQPFLKWPGGKRWLVSDHAEVLPKRIRGRYIEPFLGSAAMFFRLQPQAALLSDKIQHLIHTYQGIQEDWQGVRRLLESYQQKHSTEHYYAIRGESPDCVIARAAWLLYLNRTCFNGMYRVNRRGQFNVPVGTRSTVLFATDDFEGWAKALAKAELRCSDFETSIAHAAKGDFVFADPPYTVHHNNNGFIKYNEVLFSWNDQLRLAESIRAAGRRGARILVTNANNPSLYELYKGFRIKPVSRFSSISGSAAGRNKYEELVIMNY